MSARRTGSLPERVAFLVAGVIFLVLWWSARSTSRGFELRPVGSDVLRIATWNVGRGVDQGGGGLPSEQIADVAQSIIDLGAQAVALQELSSVGQANELASQLMECSGENWTVRVRSGSGRCVAFAALGKIEIDRAQRASGRSLFLRWTATAGLTFDVAVLHAEAFSAERRNLEIGAAVEQLEGASAEPSAGHLLLGDLNLDLDIGERGDMFTDDRHLDVETYNFATRHLDDLGLGCGPTAQPDRRLDYILASTLLEVLQAGPWSGPAIPGMDHKPLVVDLAMRLR